MREGERERFYVFFFGTSLLVKLFEKLCHRHSELANSVSLPLTAQCPLIIYTPPFTVTKALKRGKGYSTQLGLQCHAVTYSWVLQVGGTIWLLLSFVSSMVPQGVMNVSPLEKAFGSDTALVF